MPILPIFRHGQDAHSTYFPPRPRCPFYLFSATAKMPILQNS
ncbi:hypothetical protein BJP36_36310 [Moorena producens JHB]|uniref:Uncharacterized protein n=1 Tax=Moorena producens (strain JHB) TaxID=1454205 RepID=A0A9Q9STU4_MOOP1|nr:hypothetical protein [Moorena producens]WAN69554.1 hypothetical protein BJP36_36310 [Moorena producens JHB]